MGLTPAITPQLIVAIVAIVAVVVLRLAGGIDTEAAGTLLGTVLAAFGLGAAHERTAAAKDGGG